MFLVHDTATTPLHPARAEFALAVALKLVRDSTGADITPVRVCFAHPAPDNMAEHRRFFHGPVRFGAGSSSMSLSASDASRPMREADAALAGIIRRRLENALGDRDRSSAGGMSTRIRRMFVEHLGQTALTLDAVATVLGVSRRTLTRRLAEERATFRQILDEVRSDFARVLLQDRSLSIPDIAFFLTVFRTCGVPPIVPAVDRSDATSLQRGLTLTKPLPGFGAMRSAALPVTPRAKGVGFGLPGYSEELGSSLSLSRPTELKWPQLQFPSDWSLTRRGCKQRCDSRLS